MPTDPTTITTEQLKIESRYMMGSCSAGRHGVGTCGNGGILYHAVPAGAWKALCGAAPGKRSAGWSGRAGSAVTCPKCLRKVAKVEVAGPGDFMSMPKLSETLGCLKSPDRCQGCSAAFVDLIRWREHDENDKPTQVVVVLCKRCSKQIDAHPRLYAQLDVHEHHPGTMELCSICRHRAGVQCTQASFNGGPGVLVAPGPITVHVKAARPSRSGLYQLWQSAPISCSGRQVMALVGECDA